MYSIVYSLCMSFSCDMWYIRWDYTTNCNIIFDWMYDIISFDFISFYLITLPYTFYYTLLYFIIFYDMLLSFIIFYHILLILLDFVTFCYILWYYIKLTSNNPYLPSQFFIKLFVSDFPRIRLSFKVSRAHKISRTYIRRTCPFREITNTEK